MSYSAKTLFVFGVYLIGLGLSLIIIPNFALSILLIPATEEVWIRVVGMLLLYLGIFDILAARAELRPFIVWSVPVRLSVIVFITIFVLTGLVSPMFMIIGVIDFVGAIWTWIALHKSVA